MKKLLISALISLPLLSACTPSQIAQVVHNSPHRHLQEDELGWCEDHHMVTIDENDGQNGWYCGSAREAKCAALDDVEIESSLYDLYCAPLPA